MSALGLNEFASIHSNGYNIATPKMMMTTCPQTRPSRRRRDSEPDRRIGGVGASTAAAMSLASLVVDPSTGGAERQPGEEGDDDEQHPSHRGGVAHVEVDERLSV